MTIEQILSRERGGVAECERDLQRETGPHASVLRGTTDFIFPSCLGKECFYRMGWKHFTQGCRGRAVAPGQRMVCIKMNPTVAGIQGFMLMEVFGWIVTAMHCEWLLEASSF